MDILAMLNSRLDFISRFYDQAASSFEVTQRKIKAGEEPYVPVGDPEDYDGPAFLDEWIDADKCLRVLGHCCLGLLAKALHYNLREFIEREVGVPPSKVDPCLKPYNKKDGWFGTYSRFLEAHTAFRWATSPIARDKIEPINLSRNDITHDPEIDRTWPIQSEKHFEKYPVSAFADEIWLRGMSAGDGKPRCPLPINVTRQNLSAHIEYVRQFCGFVEGLKTAWDI